MNKIFRQLWSVKAAPPEKKKKATRPFSFGINKDGEVIAQLDGDREFSDFTADVEHIGVMQTNGRVRYKFKNK